MDFVGAHLCVRPAIHATAIIIVSSSAFRALEGRHIGLPLQVVKHNAARFGDPFENN